MQYNKLLYSKYFQIRRLFVIGIITVICLCILNTLYAIIRGTYPSYFFHTILSAITIIGFCINSIICLRTHPYVKKIPWDWIGFALGLTTLILFFIEIWTELNFLKYSISALALTLTYTSAIIPFTLVKNKNNKLYTIILYLHRIFTPIFGLLLVVDFAFDISEPWVLRTTWSFLLIEILIVLALSMLYIFPIKKSTKIYPTDEEKIFTDANGIKYQILDDPECTDEIENNESEESDELGDSITNPKLTVCDQNEIKQEQNKDNTITNN